MRILSLFVLVFFGASLEAWEIRLYQPRQNCILPETGAVTRDAFEALRSVSVITVFSLSENENASFRLNSPKSWYRVSVDRRQGSGVSFTLDLELAAYLGPRKGRSRIHHVDDYYYILRPLADYPILVQLIP